MPVDGPSGISSHRIHGGEVREERVGEAPQGAQPAQPQQPGQGDVVQRGGEVRAPAAGTTDLERRIAELEAREQQRVDADRVQQEKAAEEAKTSGWFKRGLLEVFEIFARIMFPPLNWIFLGIQALNVAYRWIKGETIDWKKEGLLALGNLVGGFVPFVGAAATVGNNLLMEEDHSRLFGWRVDQESGLKTAGRKAYSLGKDIVDGVQHRITGRDPAGDDKARESGIDHRPVRPAEVPVA